MNILHFILISLFIIESAVCDLSCSDFQRQITYYEAEEISQPRVFQRGSPVINLQYSTAALASQYDKARAIIADVANFWQSWLNVSFTSTFLIDFRNLTGTTAGTTNWNAFIQSYADVKTRIRGVPGHSPFWDAIPDNITVETVSNATWSGNLMVIFPLGRSLGYFSSNNTDAEIIFSTNVAWDFNPADGITSSQVDFKTTVLHEFGHALGFASQTQLASSHGGQVDISTLDLFRFAVQTPTISSPRNVISGTVVRFWDNTSTTPLFSTGSGGTNPDNYSPSHWKESATTQPFIGVMEPVNNAGDLRGVSDSDFRAMSAIGWPLAKPPPVIERVVVSGQTAIVFGLGFFSGNCSCTFMGNGPAQTVSANVDTNYWRSANCTLPQSVFRSNGYREPFQ